VERLRNVPHERSRRHVRAERTPKMILEPIIISAIHLESCQLAGDWQNEEVYAAPVMSAISLGLQLQSMMTDKASVATWEGVFEASSVEVAEVTNCLRRGAEDLTAKKKPRFSPSGEGILESELVQLPLSLIGGPPGETMARLQEDCW